MKYRVETTATFDKNFKKLDRYTQMMLKNGLRKTWSTVKIHEHMEKGLPQIGVVSGGIV